MGKLNGILIAILEFLRLYYAFGHRRPYILTALDKLLKHVHVSVEIRGVKMLVRLFSNDYNIAAEIWNTEVYPFVGISRGTIVDIGAHAGYFSIYAAKQLAASRIIAVEPLEENLKLLRKNVALYDVVEVYPIAIGSKPGMRTFWTTRYNTGGHSFHQRYRAERTSDVPTTTLASLFEDADIEKCAGLKLDCEGAEFEILTSAPEALLRNISFIEGEYHLRLIGEAGLIEMIRKLEDAGFLVKVYEPNKLGLGMFRARNHGN